ncbi:hypothetical protein Mesau_05795 [Mesorhizobium australicum WSM2073]|uniref:Electron transfer flavoprotein beta subunit n=3 Tax=Mesorhizobium TaxID=68287 RepID=L0KVP9_MESAW|nr:MULTISPECIES: hypothetical protein [Mesorhizobium]ADV14796.1 hypothetical protein Mesci_5745 [Mesorhizobium ciceri biovar biserrulae WSM1271]AEH90683.1 hypothetical protein Mesop_6321 [Mesorhizobium opportunistum WSM2075]AGB48054.1 hypothetical protein Mesau_05795 [Mesorhizobium australicum WSM2073]
MKILVPVKRVVDANVKVRVKADGSAVELANVKMARVRQRKIEPTHANPGDLHSRSRSSSAATGRKNITRMWPVQRECAPVLTQDRDRNRLVDLFVHCQIIQQTLLKEGSEVELVIGEANDGRLELNAAIVVQQMRQRDSARLRRQPVRHKPVEKACPSGADTSILVKAEISISPARSRTARTSSPRDGARAGRRNE